MIQETRWATRLLGRSRSFSFLRKSLLLAILHGLTVVSSRGTNNSTTRARQHPSRHPALPWPFAFVAPSTQQSSLFSPARKDDFPPSLVADRGPYFTDPSSHGTSACPTAALQDTPQLRFIRYIRNSHLCRPATCNTIRPRVPNPRSQ